MKKLLAIFLLCTTFNSMSPSLSEKDLDEEIQKIPAELTPGEMYHTKKQVNHFNERCPLHEDKKYLCPDELCTVNKKSSHDKRLTVKKMHEIKKQVDHIYESGSLYEDKKYLWPNECCRCLEGIYSMVQGWVTSNGHKNQ